MEALGNLKTMSRKDSCVWMWAKKKMQIKGRVWTLY